MQRIRELLKRQRTAVMNQLRGLLAEYGEVFPKTPGSFKNHVPFILEGAENELTVTARNFLNKLYQNVVQLGQEI